MEDGHRHSQDLELPSVLQWPYAKTVEIRDSQNDYESAAIEFCTGVHSDKTKKYQIQTSLSNKSISLRGIQAQIFHVNQ